LSWLCVDGWRLHYLGVRRCETGPKNYQVLFRLNSGEGRSWDQDGIYRCIRGSQRREDRRRLSNHTYRRGTSCLHDSVSAHGCRKKKRKGKDLVLMPPRREKKGKKASWGCLLADSGHKRRDKWRDSLVWEGGKECTPEFLGTLRGSREKRG